VVFAFRAYGDYTNGGFPAFSLAHFLYWNFLYSLIPPLPAYFVFQIISPSSSQSTPNKKFKTHTYKSSLHPAAKVITTILAIIVGAWVGGYIGVFFTAISSELDTLNGGIRCSNRSSNRIMDVLVYLY
jgi:hypothetical protein